MNVNEVSSLITSIGFPIVCCGFMGYFIYLIFKKGSEYMDSTNKKYEDLLNMVTTALTNNTNALKELSAKITENLKGDKNNA